MISVKVNYDLLPNAGKNVIAKIQNGMVQGMEEFTGYEIKNEMYLYLVTVRCA